MALTKDPVELTLGSVTLANLDVGPPHLAVTDAERAIELYKKTLAEGYVSEQEQRSSLQHAEFLASQLVPPTPVPIAARLREAKHQLKEALADMRECRHRTVEGRQDPVEPAVIQELWALVREINFAAHR